MRYIHFFISTAVFRIFSISFYLVDSTSCYKGTVLAWSISRSLAPYNELLLRRQISSPDNENNSPLIAINHQSLPSEPDGDNPAEDPAEDPAEQLPEPNPQQPPAPEPEPNPQPGPAPEPVPDAPPPRPLPKPQPIRIDQSPPGANVPVPVDPVRPPSPGNVPPAPAPVGVPIVPIPIGPVPPPPPAATTSAVPKSPRRPMPVPQPLTGPPRAAAPQPVGGFDRNSRPIPNQPIILTGPEVSDYPSDDQIRRDILRVPRDSTVMYTEIGGLYPVRLFAERDVPPKFLYLDAFPYGYTWSNGRSAKWYQDFLDRLCAVFSDFAMGTVYLVSKFPYGPEFACSMWNRIEYDALKANIDVNEIILVDYTNINRQRVFWNIIYGEIGPNVNPRHKRDTIQTPCPEADSMEDGYPSVSGGPIVDLTPILGANAGWASVDVTQYRREYPDVNSKLDVLILDARGKQIGGLDGAIAVPGQEVVVQSQLPFAVRIIAPATDEEPLQFEYGQLSWDSNDQSRCNFDPWKGGVREGICNFDY